MKLKRYAICPLCYETINYLTGMEMPNCDFCSSPTQKQKFLELGFKENLQMNILMKGEKDG